MVILACDMLHGNSTLGARFNIISKDEQGLLQKSLYKQATYLDEAPVCLHSRNVLILRENAKF